MEQNETRGSISIADLWEVFISHVWQIVLAGLLVLAVLVTANIMVRHALQIAEILEEVHQHLI